MNEFVTDDAWQRQMRDRILLPSFYERHYPGSYQFIDDKSLQARGVDTTIWTDAPQWIWVEEKIVRWPGHRLTAFALETRSCTVEGHEKTGWMFYGEADRLLYCFALPDDRLDCWWIDFPALQAWFWPREKTFPTFTMTARNRSSGRVVPIEAVRKSVQCRRFRVAPPTVQVQQHREVQDAP